MFLDLLVMFPADRALVLDPDPIFSSETFLVVNLRLVLLDFLNVIPPRGRLVLAVRLDAKFAPEANLVV